MNLTIVTVKTMYTVMSTMKMSGSYSHLILMVLCTIAKTNILENANNANAIKIGKFKIAHGD